MSVNLDAYGPLLNAREMAAIFGRTTNHFYRLAREGAFDLFKVEPAIPPRIYSKALVVRYLNGDDVRREVSRFGRKRA